VEWLFTKIKALKDKDILNEEEYKLLDQTNRDNFVINHNETYSSNNHIKYLLTLVQKKELFRSVNDLDETNFKKLKLVQELNKKGDIIRTYYTPKN
jgi:enolase